MWALAAALTFLPSSAAADPLPACRDLERAAPKSDFASLKPSTPDPVSCGVAGGEASNYVLSSEEAAAEELHVLAVAGGGSPPLKAHPQERPSVKVALHETRKPAILALAARRPVRWDLKLTPQARLSAIILLGDPSQDVKGTPPGIPVRRLGPEEACGLASSWEDGGRDFRRMIARLRCFSGLRESSFQGCGQGLLFEVPHYRQDAPGLYARGLPRPACPGGGRAADPFPAAASLPIAAPAARIDPAPPKRLPPDSSMPPAEPAPGPRQSLPAPEGPRSRPEIPARALAILLEGNTALATRAAVPDLIVALRRGDLPLRCRAAEALGHLGPAAEEAVAPLLEAIEDPNARLRAGAALALGNVGAAARPARRRLERLLKDPSADVRLSARTALERLEGR